jgi:hypothetical protein
MIEDVAGEVHAIRVIRGQSEVGIKIVGGKVIRFPISDDEDFALGQSVKVRLIVGTG